MKFKCTVHGVHFPGEYGQTLKPPCNFWGDLGMSTMPEDLKHKFWDWLFSMPTDEIQLRANIGIVIMFQTVVVKPEDLFENRLDGYKEMTESEQWEFQREYFARAGAGQQVDAWLKQLNEDYKMKRKLLKN